MSRYITPEEAPDSAVQSEDEEASRLIKKLELAELRKFMEFLHFYNSDMSEGCNEIMPGLEVSNGSKTLFSGRD